MKNRLHGIRLDTPSERGGVTPALVNEIRQRLDKEGFRNIKIGVFRRLTPIESANSKAAGATLRAR